ncbi:MAG: patatin, partial [Burkholderiales bacterium]|nr:patatin [Burkholderiales bacterium]
TESGLEWRNDLQFGNAAKLHTELRQPLFEREGMYISPYAEIGQNSRNLYSGNTRIAEYTFRNEQAGFDFAFRLGKQSTLGEARIGLKLNRYRIRPKLGGYLLTDTDGSVVSEPLPSADLQQFGINSAVVIDQLSDSNFPREGYKIDSNLFLGTDKSRKNYQELSINGLWAHSINSHSLNLKLSTAGLFQNDSEIRGLGSTLGGFQRLSAYQPDQFTGNFMLYGSLTYLLRAVRFDLAGQSLFLGTSLEAGNVWNKGNEISLNGLRKSASVFAGFNSFIGPIYLGFAFGQGGTRNVFFQLGRQ